MRVTYQSSFRQRQFSRWIARRRSCHSAVLYACQQRLAAAPVFPAASDSVSGSGPHCGCPRWSACHHPWPHPDSGHGGLGSQFQRHHASSADPVGKTIKDTVTSQAPQAFHLTARLKLAWHLMKCIIQTDWHLLPYLLWTTVCWVISVSASMLSFLPAQPPGCRHSRPQKANAVFPVSRPPLLLYWLQTVDKPAIPPVSDPCQQPWPAAHPNSVRVLPVVT